MSKKSRKQRAVKRVKVGVVKDNSEQLLKKQKNNKGRKEALKYLEDWQEKNNWKFSKSRQIWIVKNLYCLESVPAKNFKTALAYIDTMHLEHKTRLVKEAKAMLENDKVPFADLETRLVEEADTEGEREILRNKIKQAKLKRVQKVAAKH